MILWLLMAAFVGGLIGPERTGKRRPAGFRTYVLACLGTEKRNACVRFTLRLRRGITEDHLLRDVRQISGVVSVQEL